MKRVLLIIILAVCMLSPSACAAETELKTPQPEPLVESTDQQDREDDQELAEAEQEYREEVEGIEREWAEEQQELREEMAELEQEWKAGELDSQEEYLEGLREYQEEMADAQREMQEELKEAQKELQEATMRLSDGVIKSSGSKFNFFVPNNEFTAPNLDVFTTKLRNPRHHEPSVLFIPRKPMDDKVAEQLSEDMQVMSMILEKAADVAPHSEYGGGRSTGYGMYIGEIGIFRGYSSDVPEVIYLEDYGMIFRLQLDFPLLLIGGDEQPKQQVEEDITDEVWQQSKNKLKGIEPPRDGDGDRGPAFDPERVEKLQQQLVKMLRHASNIRNLSDKDRIVFVVQGTDPRQQPVTIVPTSVMTLQAAKQDIDAFAAEKIDLDAFTKKVVTVVY